MIIPEEIRRYSGFKLLGLYALEVRCCPYSNALQLWWKTTEGAYWNNEKLDYIMAVGRQSIDEWQPPSLYDGPTTYPR